jgi:hydroxymethylbilane synthase
VTGSQGSLRLATRGSPLALLQAQRVAAALGDCELVVVKTRGDTDSTSALSAIGGQGVFVKEIQTAVLEGRADAAVHSAKDLPSVTPDGLFLACVPERADPRDVMIGTPLGDLAPGAVVATGSPRRRAQLAGLRPDLAFCELRGNIATRIERAEAIGAGVLAMAGLERLGLAGHAVDILDPTEMLPQVGQGAIAVECRSDDEPVLTLLREIDDPVAHVEVLAERSWLSRIGGGCSLPVAAFARAQAGTLTLEAMIATNDGRMVIRKTASGADPHQLGRDLAEEMVERGGARAIEGWDGIT